MLACVSPLACHLEHSAATLHFATVAARIQTRPVMHVDPQDKVRSGTAAYHRRIAAIMWHCVCRSIPSAYIPVQHFLGSCLLFFDTQQLTGQVMFNMNHADCDGLEAHDLGAAAGECSAQRRLRAPVHRRRRLGSGCARPAAPRLAAPAAIAAAASDAPAHCTHASGSAAVSHCSNTFRRGAACVYVKWPV